MLKPYQKPTNPLVRANSKEKVVGILNVAANRRSSIEASRSSRQLSEHLEPLESPIAKKKSCSEKVLQTPDTKKTDADLEVRRGSAVTDVQTVSSAKKQTVEFLCVFEDCDTERVCWLSQVEQMEPADWIGHVLGLIKRDGGIPQCLKCGSAPALAVFMNCTHGGYCPVCAQTQALADKSCYCCSKVVSS